MHQPPKTVEIEDNTLGEGAPTEEIPPMDIPLGEGILIEGNPILEKSPPYRILRAGI